MDGVWGPEYSKEHGTARGAEHSFPTYPNGTVAEAKSNTLLGHLGLFVTAVSLR